ncbi:Cof-type HAD-IIB family hydrolase [Companilactobacillus kimchiensis]|uniref:Cof-like hydrolase n=1 Tax=Companilactobacillus kimchiensis TaxID=993692 RepID=A0A0R2LJR8_9LACO|nr:Cof-type HAD-IIB family hydrolase [Companilactobacillus kimchiensis]KRO00155.1 Cof-like hydrolase [Companilactobacillus kimchiensis]
MDYKLIAIDIDGTLLNDKQKITKENIQAIRQALNKGIKVVLCSGRAYDGVIGNAQEIGLNGPDQYMIYFGGNIIQNYDDQIIYQKALHNEDCEEIANFLMDHKIHFDLIDNKGTHYDSYQDWIEKHMLDTNLGIVKFLLRTHKHDLTKMADLIHTTYDGNYFVVQTSDQEIEMFPKDVNKGIALEYLVKHLKIDIKQVMAIGDMDNDLPMLKRVGLSVAMGNATDEVKEISRVETLDNNHSGVAAAINKYILELTEVK